MRNIQYREALREAMQEEMRLDDRVFLMGEEVAQYNGAYKVSQGMLDEFGPRRIVDSPISETGFSGLGVGAAMYGLRPIIEFMSWSFCLVAADQIINNAPKMLYMSGGQFGCPAVFRGNNGAGGQLGSTHSWCVESMFSSVPGLKVAIPSTPRDAKGLLKTAIRDEDPVFNLESERMLGLGARGDKDFSRYLKDTWAPPTAKQTKTSRSPSALLTSKNPARTSPSSPPAGRCTSRSKRLRNWKNKALIAK